ncbi:MAG: imidazole glycerol phosphate synthase subunit HisH [Bacteroidota bacterium]
MTTIIDYGTGNVFSILKKLQANGVQACLSDEPKIILNSDRLILPGVGHFGKAMNHLRKSDLDKVLQEAVLERKKNILGICLGMQLMTQGSEEGDEEGLGWFQCKTQRLSPIDTSRYKIPHIGWNTVQHNESHPIFTGVESGSEMYFVHAYGVLHSKEEEVLSTTTYENLFVSSLQKNNIVGMQFHPEKSHVAGSKIFQNFTQCIDHV